LQAKAADLELVAFLQLGIRQERLVHQGRVILEETRFNIPVAMPRLVVVVAQVLVAATVNLESRAEMAA